MTRARSPTTVSFSVQFGPTSRPGGDLGRALELGVGPDRGVGLQGGPHVDPGGRRVDDGGALDHPAPGDPLVHQPPQIGQLRAVVGGQHLVVVLGDHGADREPVADGDRQHVGEQLLALGVVRGEPAERVAQDLAVEGEDPGVDLVDRPLRRRAVLLLDDAEHPALGGAVRLAQDPAQARRVRDHGGQVGDGVAGLLVLGDQVPQRVPGDHGAVAEQHQHGAVGVLAAGGQRLQRQPRGLAGPVLRLLHDDPGLRRDRLDVRAHQVAALAHDDGQAARSQLLRGGDHVAEHRAPAQLVQHLRGRGFHPLPLAGGQDDDGRRVLVGHEVTPSRGCGAACRAGLITPRRRRFPRRVAKSRSRPGVPAPAGLQCSATRTRTWTNRSKVCWAANYPMADRRRQFPTSGSFRAPFPGGRHRGSGEPVRRVVTKSASEYSVPTSGRHPPCHPCHPTYGSVSCGQFPRSASPARRSPLKA